MILRTDTNYPEYSLCYLYAGYHAGSKQIVPAFFPNQSEVFHFILQKDLQNKK
jgi:hypothetical protein